MDQNLCQCLDSVFNQNYPNIELIIVNDGSTDDCFTILEIYHSRNPHIIIINHRKNLGLLQSRKTGIMKATGQYCCFIDGDDYLPSNDCLFHMVNLILEKKVDVLQFSVTVIHNEALSNADKYSSWLKPYQKLLVGSKRIVRACFIQHKFSHHLWNKIYLTVVCKKAYHSMPNVYMTLGEDVYASFLIATNAHSYIGVRSTPLYAYRIGTGVSTKHQNAFSVYVNRIRSETYVLKSIRAVLTQCKTLNQFRHELEALEEIYFNQHIALFNDLPDSLSTAAYDVLLAHYPAHCVVNTLLKCCEYNLTVLQQKVRSSRFQST